MLKLKYIICENLPEYEQKYLRNHITEQDNEIEIICQNGLNEDLITRENGGKTFADEKENGIFISSDRQILYRAAKEGMATICYLPPIPVTEELAGFSPDMYVEGFEEVDVPFLQHVFERHHHIPWTILETKRCIVKEFSMEYLDALFELYAGDGMTEFIEPLYPYEQEKEYQQAYIDNMYAFYGYGMWIVCDKETGKLIGRAGVEHREELDGQIELGYAIGTPYQRQGYATEVCEAILAYIREELGMNEVCCLIDEDNKASEYLVQKLGFVLEEEICLQGRRMNKYGLSWGTDKEV